MRILHFSDLHIGVENYGLTDPETGLSSRLLDFLHTYDQVVQYALDQEVDLVLFAGDAYKSRDPSQTHQREFARRIATLVQRHIPVFLLVGNHDLPSIASRATALEIFPTLDIPNVTVADRLTTTLLPTPAGPLQVVSLPWIRRGAFLAREETRDLTIEEINKALEERLTQLLHREAEALDPNVPALLTAHASLNTAVTSSEQSMMLGRDHVLLQSNLALPAFDYVALGHVHKHQLLAHGHPLVAYSGSLQRIDFGEERDTKGFCVIDLDPKRPRGERLTNFQFIPVDARPFVTIPVGIEPGEPDPTDAVLRAIQRHRFQEAIVRLQVRIPEELEPLLRETTLRQALAEAHYVAAIYREVMRQRRPRLSAEAVESMTPAQVLRRYLEEQRIPASRMEALLHHGQELIREELEDEG